MRVLKVMLKVVMIIIIVIAIIAVVGLGFLYFYPGVGKTPDSNRRSVYAERTEYYYDGQFHN